MVNTKSSDFELFKMMQEFKNDLLHHFLKKFNLEYFDFGIISEQNFFVNSIRPIVFDNAIECMTINFLQDQKINLILFLNYFYENIKNGIITKSHYVKRDTKLSSFQAGSYEYFEIIIKNNLYIDDEYNINNLTGIILDNLKLFLQQFSEKKIHKSFHLFTSNPYYYINCLSKDENRLSVINHNNFYKSMFDGEYNGLTDDKSNSALVLFYIPVKEEYIDLMYVTILKGEKEREEYFKNELTNNDDLVEINHLLDEITTTQKHFVYLKINITNLIYYFFKCKNINEVEPCYLNTRLKNKYKKKNEIYKINY